MFKSEVSDKTWIARWTILAAGLATIAGSAFAFGQDKNDGFDRPLNGEEKAEAEQEAQGNSSSTTYMSMSENGKQYSMEARDGKVTRVEIDGKRVPKDRWRYDGKKLEILDEKGDVEKTMDLQFGANGPHIAEVPGIQMHPRVRVFQGDRDAIRRDANRAFEELRRAEAGQMRGQQNWNRALAPVAQEQPKVMLGVTFSEVGEDEDGVVIDSVVEGLPADKAGLKEGDVILKVGDKEVAGSGTFRSMLRDFKADDKVDMTVLRDGQKRTVTIVLEAYDAEKLGLANQFAFPDGHGVFVMPDDHNQLGQADRERMGQLFGLSDPFSGADRDKVREQFDTARKQMQEALEQMKTIDKVDFEKARDEATRSLKLAMESLEAAQEKLTTTSRRGVWTKSPRGELLVAPTPTPPSSVDSSEMKKLLEKLEQLETKVEELQKKKD